MLTAVRVQWRAAQSAKLLPADLAGSMIERPTPCVSPMSSAARSMTPEVAAIDEVSQLPAETRASAPAHV